MNAPAVILKNNAPKKNYLSISFKGDGMNTIWCWSKAYCLQKRENAIPAINVYKRF